MTRLVVWACLGVLTNTLGYAWDSAEFWCFIGLFWATDTLARNEGRQEGVAVVLDMPMLKIAERKAELERILQKQKDRDDSTR
jgi:hypothetical protein